jgi:hypothetical protein
MQIDVLWEEMRWSDDPHEPGYGHTLEVLRDEHSLVERFLTHSRTADLPSLRFIGHETDSLFHQDHIPLLLGELKALSEQELEPEVEKHLHAVRDFVRRAYGKGDTFIVFRARVVETLHFLRWHAGIERDGPSDQPSIVSVTSKPVNKKSLIEKAASDVVHLLEKMNHDLNGPKPSAVSVKTPTLPRHAVFVVEKLRRMLKDAADQCGGADQEALLSAEARISSAWSAVVAGDIDDVVKYTDEQD